MRLLLIDDDRMSLEVLGRTLHIAGHECYAHTDPLAAIKWLSEGHEVDTVITDLKMPEMNGLELIRDLKQNYPNLTVLAVTAYVDQELMWRNSDLEVDLMRKPLDISLLLERLQQLEKESGGKKNAITDMPSPYGNGGVS